MRISFIIIQSLASIWTSFWIHISSHTHIKSSASFRHHAPVNYASSYVILTWHLFLIYLSCLYAAMFICKLKLNLLPFRYIYAFRVKWWYPRHLASFYHIVISSFISISIHHHHEICLIHAYMGISIHIWNQDITYLNIYIITHASRPMPHTLDTVTV